MALASPAQTLTTVYDFCSQPSGANCNDGFFPVAEVMQGTDGSFYGTTYGGGAYTELGGTVFKNTPSGTLTTLHSFCSQPDCAGDGGEPWAGLVQATDGNFYGTTLIGGAPSGGGTIFKVSPDGTFSTLYSFCPNYQGCPDGADPSGTLVQGTDGSLYGTTQFGGGIFNCGGGLTCGTVFKITLGGTLTTLHAFNGADGYLPFGGLVQAADGNFYRTTQKGGANQADCGNGGGGGCGTVFKITPGGIFTTLYSFCSQPNCADGYYPRGALVQGTDGNLYGTTLYTCNGDCGGGSVFKITPSGTLTTLHTFTGGADGQAPWAGLIQATDGNFYGTASLGGANGDGGTVFQITPSGAFTTLYSFCSLPNCADGKTLDAKLVQATDGSFYGTTLSGGTINGNCQGELAGCGTVFRLTAGLSPTNWLFVPVPPCRVVDTRGPNGPFGGPPIQGGLFRSFAIPQQPDCNIPSSAVAYSLNVTVVPHGPLGYLTIWPTGRPQPYVSTMNSPDGRIKANAAIVPAGGSGGVNVYVTDTTDVVLDIDGYFAPAGQNTYQFYPLTPCRVVDTRAGSKQPQGLGPPSFGTGETRPLPVLTSPCLQNLNPPPQAYSFNATVVPHPAGQPLNYLTLWPTGQSQPVVSTLNNPTATVVANGAIVPAGTNGEMDVYTYNSTDLIIDVNGYFAASTQGGLSLHAVVPCRAYDSRNNNGQPFNGERTVNIVNGPCAPPNAQAYVFNATVVPNGFLDYLTLWPDSENQPIVSTLNAHDGFITTNMAIVPNINGSIDAYASQLTQLILDISGYFAP